MSGEDETGAPTLDTRDWETDSGGAAPPADELFGVLSNAARRHILAYLIETPRTTIEELSDVLVGWAAAESGPVGPRDREPIQASLYHVHLPALADAGLIAYDGAADGGEVELRTLARRTRDVIRLADRYDRIDRSGADGTGTDSLNDGGGA